MTLTLVLILYILLAIEIISIEIFKRRKGFFFFDFLTIANFFFLLSYSITPLFYLVVYESNILPDNSYIDYIAALSFVSYQFFLAGWLFAGGFKLKIKKELPKNILELKWFKLGTFFLIITGLMIILVVIGKGGLANYLGGALSRYSFEDLDSGSFSFLSRLTNIAPFLTTIFFYFLIQKDTNIHMRTIKILFFIALALSLFQIFGGASRGGMVRLFILMGLVYVLVKKRVKALPTIIIIVFGFLFISYGKQTFYAVSNLALKGEKFSESFIYLDEIRSNEDKTGNDIIFREFSHPYKSIDAAIRYDNNGYYYTYFKDFFWSVFRILPSRFTSLFLERPEPIHVINTTLLTGVQDSGGIPPGLIASFYYSLGIAGVFIGCFLYGSIGRHINTWLFSMMNTSTIYSVPFAFFSYYFGFFIANGDPNIYIYYILMPIIFILCLKFVRVKNLSLNNKINGPTK